MMFTALQKVDNTQLVLLLAAPALALWFVVSFYRQYQRLSHIPGPRTAGFCKWWLVRSTFSSRHHLELYQACKKYGELDIS